MKDGDQIDPASIRKIVAGRTYRIGLRVMTPEGPATVTGFDFDAAWDIGVTLDSTGEEVYTEWRYAEPLEEQTVTDNVIPVLAALARAGACDMDDQRAVATEAALRFDHAVSYWLREASPEEYQAALDEARAQA